MKKILVLALLAAASLSAQANCSITMVRDPSVADAFDNNGGWNFDAKKFDVLCEKLRKHRARINVQGMATVLSDRSISWAALSLQDMDSGIATTSFANLQILVNTYASQNKADQMLNEAINKAAQDWNEVDKALERLEDERQRVRGKAGAAARPARR